VWIVGATHEPVGLYPSGDTTVHLYASDDDGQTWASAFQRPFQNPLGYVAATVQFAYPDGDFPIQIIGYGTLVGKLAPRQPENLLLDSDVELEAGDFFGTNGPGTFVLATDAAHGGTHSLRIVGSTSGLSRWYSQPLATATAGHTYTASAWLKTQSSSNATVDLNFWSASGTYLGANYESAPSTALGAGRRSRSRGSRLPEPRACARRCGSRERAQSGRTTSCWPTGAS
jgi:hypothetical protein